MQFTIITPSFNQLAYLKRCIASVADQCGDNCTVHHHVQDGGSNDGTVAFLERNAQEFGFRRTNDGYSFSYTSEDDDGMYDAINKGIDLAGARERLKAKCNKPAAMSFASERQMPNAQCPHRDSVIAWLNCDEQYLPGTLQKVSDHFDQNPASDFVCGNTLNLSPDYSLLTYRKNPPLRKVYVQADYLYVQSAATFFRAKIFQQGLRFGRKWKAVEDSDFFLSVLDQGYRPSRLNDYLSVLVMTGDTLSESETGRRELAEWRKSMPVLARSLRFPLKISRHVEKWIAGGYSQQFPLEYAVYTGGESAERREMTAAAGSHKFSWG